VNDECPCLTEIAAVQNDLNIFRAGQTIENGILQNEIDTTNTNLTNLATVVQNNYNTIVDGLVSDVGLLGRVGTPWEDTFGTAKLRNYWNLGQGYLEAGTPVDLLYSDLSPLPAGKIYILDYLVIKYVNGIAPYPTGSFDVKLNYFNTIGGGSPFTAYVIGSPNLPFSTVGSFISIIKGVSVDGYPDICIQPMENGFNSGFTWTPQGVLNWSGAGGGMVSFEMWAFFNILDTNNP